jgi:hypothetical protein
VKSLVSCFLQAACVWIVIASASPIAAVAQSNQPADIANAGTRIWINVVVTDKKGQPIRGLHAEDFTVFDSQEPQKLLGFRVASVRAATLSYELTIKAPASDHSNEYHPIEVLVDRPNLIVRTIQGY